MLGTGLTLAGSLINSQMQNDQIRQQNAENQKAMDMERAAREEETTRQRAMEDQQVSQIFKSLAQADPSAATQQVQETAKLSPIAQSTQAYNAPALPGQAQGGQVAEGISRIIEDRLKGTQGILDAQATLSSQGGVMANIAQALQRMQSDVATVGSNRRGSMGASRMETSIPAATVSRSQSPIGDLALIVGQGVAGRGGRSAARPS